LQGGQIIISGSGLVKNSFSALHLTRTLLDLNDGDAGARADILRTYGAVLQVRSLDGSC
jgi:hypothetical protein